MEKQTKSSKIKKMKLKGLTILALIVTMCALAAPVAAQPTPFMIYGYVSYEDGTACNGSVVNITNLNITKEWSADTNASYNYYQLMLANGTNVNASEILQFNVTSPDGNQSNITDHEVTQENITDGGLFNFNITLVLPSAPTITDWYNNKTLNDSTALTINESECVYFNATADQSIDVWSWFVNGTNQTHNFDNFSYCGWTVNGTYYVEVNATNANGTSNNVTWTVTVNDITPPAKVTGLKNDTPTANTVNLSWTASTAPDFTIFSVYKAGALLGNTTSTYCNVTGLNAGTTYYFNVSAWDDNNNEGEWSDGVTITTAAYPAPVITGWYNNKTLNDSTALTINESECVLFNATADQPIGVWSWFVNGTNQTHNFDNLSYCDWVVNGTYYVEVNGTNANGTSSTVIWTVMVNDITPPASVSNLHNITYAQTYINWSWTNPADTDFNHTMVYINGNWEENVSSLLNYYNATGLSSNTNNTISTHTVDSSGNVNQTWVNHSAWTAPSEDTTPPASITGLHNTTYEQTYINWTWDDPADSDFSHVMVYIDGDFKDNVIKGMQYYNATGFGLDTEHIISTRTVDTSGNVNQSWINHTARTAPDTTPPEVYDFSNLSSAGVDKWAYRYQIGSNPFTKNDPTIEFVGTDKKGEYTMISKDDHKMQKDSTNVTGYYAAHRFVFNIAESADSIVEIDVQWTGKGVTRNRTQEHGATLYIWNNTNTDTGYYEQLNFTNRRQRKTLTGNITANIENYIYASGNLTILVVQNANQTETLKERALVSMLSTDYVRADITYSE